MEREQLERLLARVARGENEARESLLAYIRQQPQGIQVLALEALEDGGDDTFEQLMLTLADDPNLVIRQPAPRPRAEAPPAPSAPAPSMPRATPTRLLETLRQGERNERVQAARQLGDHADPTTIAALLDAIRSGDRQVAAAAVEALQAIGAPAVPLLVPALDVRDEQVRWHVAKALSTTADERAAPALVRVLEDGNYGIRWLAAEGLVHAGRAAVVPLLRQLAESKASPWLRQGAWHVFNKLDVPQEEERQFYRDLATQIKRANAATLPDVARQALRRLGHDA